MSEEQIRVKLKAAGIENARFEARQLFEALSGEALFAAVEKLLLYHQAQIIEPTSITISTASATVFSSVFIMSIPNFLSIIFIITIIIITVLTIVPFEILNFIFFFLYFFCFFNFFIGDFLFWVVCAVAYCRWDESNCRSDVGASLEQNRKSFY